LTPDLPVDAAWFETKRLTPNLWLITEPRVHPIFSANIHLVLGRDTDLLIDSGMGVAALRPVVDALRPDPAKPLICLSTHTHVDHIGSVHEFDQRLVHPIEANALAAPAPYSLRSDMISDVARALFLNAGYPPLWPLLIDALPNPEYDIDAYTLRGAEATGTVTDGDVIDLGCWQAEVLHLPGHAPGQVGLFHHDSGTLFGADAIYDGPLIFDGAGMSIPDYATTLHRIKALPVQVVHGGHDPHFGKARLDEIVADHLTRWGA
jgi:glyoxylase-like metal-dependent hydrolase (beta-lactamase superfamily II)